MAVRSEVQNKSALLSLLLGVGIGVSVLLRLAVGGPGVAQSPVAGVVFATCLVLLSLAAGVAFRFSRKALISGLAGGLFLCLPAVLFRLVVYDPMVVAANGYLSWAVVVSVVAFAEEMFLRGALFEAVVRWRGDTLAVLIGGLAFAALHFPLYGWHAMPLDLAVGLFLGALRLYSGTFVAPGVAHAFADLLAWWLR